MKKLLKKNQKIYIIPEDIKGAFSSKIIKSAKNILEIQTTADDIAFYNSDDNIEAFSVVNEGVLYFKPRVAEVDKKENVLKIEFDEKNCNLLQRRENLLSMKKLVVSNKLDCNIDYIGLYKATGAKIQ